MDARRPHRAVILSCLPARAARSELAQSGCPSRHLRRHAFLAATWCRRFRVDVLWHLIKDAEFRDNPPNSNFCPGRPPHEALLPLYSTDRPEILNVVTETRRVVDEFRDRVLIGEIYLPIDGLIAYYDKDRSGAHLPFNFALLSAPWNAGAIAKLIDD